MAEAVDTIDPHFTAKVTEVSGQTVKFCPGLGGYMLQVGFDPSQDLKAGQHLRCTLHAEAPQLWSCQTGGRFIEPLRGRPYRLQGTVAAHLAEKQLLLDVGILVHVAITGAQSAKEFPLQTLIHCYCRPNIRLQVSKN